MKKYYIYIIIVVLFLVAVLSYFLINKKSENQSFWKCVENNTETQKNGWIKVGNPKNNKPEIPCGIEEEKIAVKDFLTNYISILSKEKEILGGKFYITNFELKDNNSGIVEYEDGHIALKASFTYKIDKNFEQNTYSVKIDNFNIIK